MQQRLNTKSVLRGIWAISFSAKQEAESSHVQKPEEGFSGQELNMPWYQAWDQCEGQLKAAVLVGEHWSLGLGTSKLHGHQKNLQIFWQLLSRSFTLNRSCLLRQCQGRFSVRKGFMNSRVLSASSGPAHRCKPWFTAVRKDHLWCARALFQQLLWTSGNPGVCLQGENRSDTKSVGTDFLAFSRRLLCFPYDIAAEADSPGPVRDGEVSGRQWFLRDCTV